MGGSRLLIATGVALACTLACSTPPPAGWLDRHSRAPKPEAISNLQMAPTELEARMRSLEFEVREVESAGSGVMGALRTVFHYPDLDRGLAFKWKIAPPGGEGWNNTPRREIAAYEIQKWFLDPQLYVVPPSIALCIPLQVHWQIEAGRGPNIEGSRCVFGTLSAWLDDVEVADRFYEEDRFYSEPGYALHLANYNQLNYLIDNRDTRAANRLSSQNESNRRVYSIDNGITFGERIYNYFRPHWNEIRVPALSRESIDRLRKIEARDLDRLRVVAQFQMDGNGVMREVEPTASFDPETGVHLRNGILQLGLAAKEIEDLRERIDELIQAVDEGEISVF